jgi:hypothetical protein
MRSKGEDEAARDELVTWRAKAGVKWCVVSKTGRIVNRRDGGTLLAALWETGLLPVAGAPGSAREMVVRSSAAKLHLDCGIVKPGILVSSATGTATSVGKGLRLQAYLQAIGLECEDRGREQPRRSSAVLLRLQRVGFGH